MRYLLCVIYFISGSTLLLGQALDSSFHSPTPVRAAFINSMIKQPDGNYLIAGEIGYYGSTPVHNLIRLHSDGTLDNSFSFEREGGFLILEMELLPSGDIIVLLEKYNPFTFTLNEESRIVKVKPDGSIDKELVVRVETSSLCVQNDGKILVGGRGNYLTRYNTDFTLDEAFNSAVSFNGQVTDIKNFGDKIFVSGTFDIVNGVTKNDIVKLNSDGSIDNSFDTGEGTSDYIGSLTILADGKILPGITYINSFNGHTRTGNVRLMADGSVDDSFQATYLNGPIGKSIETGDGIYLSGSIYHDGVTADFLFRLKMDGSFDEAFNPVQLDYAGSWQIGVITDGPRLIISTSQVGGNVYGLSEIDNTGNYHTAFSPQVGRIGMIRGASFQDDKIIIAGDFVRTDELNTFGLARLNGDGTVDESFSLKNNRGAVWQVKLMDDHEALVTTYKEFFKVDTNGDLKSDFHWSPAGSLYQVVKFIVLPNGEIMVGDPNTLSRLHSNGTVDQDFVLATPTASSTAFDFDMQGDKIIYSHVKAQGENAINDLERLTSSAGVDTSFDPGTGLGDTNFPYYSDIEMVKVLDNDEVLLAGAIPIFNGHDIPHGLVKLSADGVLDETFNSNQAVAPGPESSVTYYGARAQQIGSKVYIRGIYGIYVVNTDGTVDTDFSIPASVEGLTDILAYELASSSGRMATGGSSLLAFGSFKVGNNARQAIVKMNFSNDKVTGIKPKEGDASLTLKVYPKPTTGMLNVTMENEKGDFSAEVYSIAGTKIKDYTFNRTIDSEPTQLDVSPLSSGLYLLKVTSATGKTGFEKFMRVP